MRRSSNAHSRAVSQRTSKSHTGKTQKAAFFSLFCMLMEVGRWELNLILDMAGDAKWQMKSRQK